MVGLSASDAAAVVSQKLAGARAELWAGFSVDGKHQWGSPNHHEIYMLPATARIAAATSTLEDIFDAVRDYLIIQHETGN
jgi:hypothetical protein